MAALTAAAQELLHFLERIERLQEERKTLADDIADLFKEMSGRGFDKDAAKIVLKIRATDDGLEQWTGKSDRVDAYLSALGMLPPMIEAHAGARPREIIEEFDAETGEIKDEPEAAAEVAGDYLRKPVAAEQGQIIREGDAPRETDCQAGEVSQGGSDASRPDTDHQSEQPCTATGPSEEAGASSDETPATHSSVESRERQTTIAVSKPEATPKDRSLPSAGPSGTAAQVSPSAVSTRTVEETAEPAVAHPQSPAATADPFENDLCADDPTIARQDMQTEPARVGSGDLHSTKSERPLHTNPLPNSSPSSEAPSSPLTTTAGDVLTPLASPATPSEKPGCLKLKDGHCKISFATSALCAECNAAKARVAA